MDDKDVPTLDLHADWMSTLIESGFNTGTVDTEAPSILLNSTCRRFVLHICKILKVTEDQGLYGEACCLLERFIHKNMYNNFGNILLPYTLKKRNAIIITEATLFPLHTSVCIKLAAANLSGKPITAKIIQTQLAYHLDCQYTTSQIISCEYKVFKTLGFRTFIWTGVQTAEFLAFKLNVDKKVLNNIYRFINFAEQHLYTIIDIFPYDNFSTESGKEHSNLSRPQVIVGAIFACLISSQPSIINEIKMNFLEKLSQIVCTPSEYIRCIANMILELIKESAVRVVNCKRKHP